MSFKIGVIYYIDFFQRSHYGRGFDNLTKDIIDVLKKHACVSYVNGATKLMSFVSNIGNVFQVMKHRVIHQIQDKFVLRLEGIHYMTQHTNLVVETLFQIPIVKHIKDLFKSFYSFSCHNPQNHLEFLKLANLMKVKGNKIL
jgi:hypothetical protein